MRLNRQQLLNSILAIFTGAVIIWILRLPSKPKLSPPPPAQYTITDLGTLDGNTSNSTCEAFAINEKTLIAGSSERKNKHSYAVLYTQGALKNLGTLGGEDSDATDINDAGQIVGEAALANDDLHAFVYRNSKMVDLGTLGGRDSYAFGINNQGQIIGVSSPKLGMGVHAFLYDDGKMRDLGTLGGKSSLGQAINDAGHVVGTADRLAGPRHAFLFRNGKMVDLGTIGSGDATALNLNNQDDVVGYVTTEQNGKRHWQAFLTRNGAFLPLPTLGGENGVATAINDHDDIVGYSETDIPTPHPFQVINGRRAFLYRQGAMHNLNDLIDAQAHWVLYDANGINNAGQIVGSGSHEGQLRAFLMTPISLIR